MNKAQERRVAGFEGLMHSIPPKPWASGGKGVGMWGSYALLQIKKGLRRNRQAQGNSKANPASGSSHAFRRDVSCSTGLISLLLPSKYMKL